MNKTSRHFIIAAFVAAIGLSFAYGAPINANMNLVGQGQKASGLPPLTLQHWQESAKNEKLAFLFGVASMIELEKEWQGDNPLPLSKSLNHTWVRGLAGVSLTDMLASLDNYAKENPSLAQMHVMEALGRIYVRPKLTEAEIKQTQKKTRALKPENK